MPNVADIISQSAAAHPDRTAIILDDHELSYQELAGVMLPNVLHFAAC
jgi:non-ribosomal peptide synthetase component E (peptide arylation enzyme)